MSILNGWKPDQEIYSVADQPAATARLDVYPAIRRLGSLIAAISKVKDYEYFYFEASENFHEEIITWKWLMQETFR